MQLAKNIGQERLSELNSWQNKPSIHEQGTTVSAAITESGHLV